MLRFVLVGLCGCGRLGFDALTDGPPPDVAPSGGFANPVSLDVAGSDPHLRVDGRELWTSFQNPVLYELRVARRTSTSVPFAVPAIEPALDSVENETDPSLTPDGLELIFVSSRGPMNQLFHAVRGSALQDFAATPELVPGLEAFEVYSATLVGDDILYFTQNIGELYRSERAGRGSPFGAPVRVAAPPVGWPAVSLDELELFANVEPELQIGVAYAARRTVDDPFVVVNMLDFASCPADQLADPQLSKDGRSLTIRCAGGVSVLSRQ